MRLLHISDLHIASSGFVPEWGDRLVSMVAADRPDLVVVTGDLVDTGLEHEYEAARSFLEGLQASAMVVVPGNHDVKYNGGTLFETYFGSRYPTFESPRAVVVGADSSQPDLDDGVISDHQLAALRERLGGHPDKIKILALHHHLMPIPDSGRDRDIVANAGDVLKLCLQTGVHLVLSGHMHRPWVWRLEGLHLVSAGTATTNRFKGGTHPSFWAIDLGAEPALVECNVRDGSTKSVRLDVPAAGGDRAAPIAPLAPPESPAGPPADAVSM